MVHTEKPAYRVILKVFTRYFCYLEYTERKKYYSNSLYFYSKFHFKPE